MEYLNHYVSKRQYPTRVVQGSGGGRGTNVVGRVPARRALEARLKRKLAPNTVEDDTRVAWRFREPKVA